MFFFWRIRYLDRRDRQFKDRDLWLVSDLLEPSTKAAVEALHDIREVGKDRAILRFRNLFKEGMPTQAEQKDMCEKYGGHSGFCIPNYCEDEAGRELTYKEMAVILTGNPDATMYPGVFRPFDIEYAQSEKPPIDLDSIELNPDKRRILGIFTRDLKELKTSALFREGAGTLYGRGDCRCDLKTAVTEEEIRSFVTIFRRLHMQKEPANFFKAVEVFCQAVGNHPLTRWVASVAREHPKN